MKGLIPLILEINNKENGNKNNGKEYFKLIFFKGLLNAKSEIKKGASK